MSLPSRRRKHLGGPEGRRADDDVALEAGREVAVGADAHVVGLALEDDGRPRPAASRASTP